MLITLKPNHPTEKFHRTVDGELVIFHKYQTVDADEAMMSFISDDIGLSLAFAYRDEHDKLRVDHEATAMYVRSRNKAKGEGVEEPHMVAIDAVAERLSMLEELDEGDILVVDSQIPVQLHQTLMDNGLATHGDIVKYLDEGRDLTKLELINGDDAKQISGIVGFKTEADQDDEPEAEVDDDAVQAQSSLDADDAESEPEENPLMEVEEGETPLPDTDIPKGFQQPLYDGGLTSLEKVAAYIEDGLDLTELEGIGKKGAEQIAKAIGR